MEGIEMPSQRQRYHHQKLWPVTFFPMTRAERDALTAPPHFLTIVNTDDFELQFYNGADWTAIAKYAPGASADLFGQVHTFIDDDTAMEVRRTYSDFTETVDAATSGTMTLWPVDHTHTADTDYKVEIDGAGAHGVATFKWSDDGGSTWDGTGVSMVDANGWPVTVELQNGVLVKFGQGEYTLGDNWTWTAIGTDTQIYDLKVDTTNSVVKIGSELQVANDPNFGLWTSGANPFLWFDSQDALYYNRADNQFIFQIADGTGMTVGASLVQLQGQSLAGGPGAGDNFTLQSTTNATKGKILFGTSGYNEANNRLGIGNAAPTQALDVTGNIAVSGTVDGVDIAARDHAQAHGAAQHTEGTAWRMTYQGAAGDDTEIALGANGTFLESIAPECKGVHSLTIRDEGGTEFLYGAHLAGNRVAWLEVFQGNPHFVFP